MIPDVKTIMDEAAAWVGFARGRLGLGGRPRAPDYSSEDLHRAVSRAVSRIHPARMRLRLDEVISETPSVRTFRFYRMDGPLPPFSAGQYVALHLRLGRITTSRPYSISSAPGEDHLDITVKRKKGGLATGHLFDSAAPGDIFDSTGPAGWFGYEPLTDGDDLVFLAGGTGIAPFMSMLRDFERRGLNNRVVLLYGSTAPNEIVFKDELDDMASRLDWLEVVHVLSAAPSWWEGRRGFLDEAAISEAAGDPDGRMFYACGPAPMLELCTRALSALGVPRHRFRVEAFGLPEDVTGQPGWPHGLSPDREFTVEVDGGGSLPARAGEPLITALERAGYAVRSVCRSGECGACRVKVASGTVFLPPGAHVRESDLAHGFVHACAAFPTSDVRVVLPGPGTTMEEDDG